VGNYCRLFRRHPGVRFEGRVHEQIYPSLRRAGLTVAPSRLAIEHDGYALDAEALTVKKRRNLAILEEEIAERPGDHFVQFNLGITCFALHDLGKAEAMLRAAVRQTDESLSREVLAIAHARLSQCALARGDREQSEKDARNSLACDADQAIPRFVLATIACHEERFLDAAREFHRILAAGEVLSGDGLDRAEVSRELGICLYKAGKFDEAAEAFATSARGRPADAGIRLFTGNALAHAGHLEAAIEAYREALSVDPGLGDARGNLETLATEVGYKHFDGGRPAEALALIPPDTRNTELLF
jgi:tetratricopeptide (TPR) repeat protein